jgi:acetyl esterase/lipase
MPFEVAADGSVQLAHRTIRVPNTISPEAQAFLGRSPFGNAPTPPAGTPMWVMREAIDAQMLAMNDIAQKMYPADIEEMQIGGVRCHMVRPKEIPARNQGRVMINLHGGGFVLGSGALVEAIPIANLAQVPVIAVDYRLAPEHPFPAAVDDALAVYRQLLQYHKPEQIGIFGSSAGAFLTVQLMARILREGLPRPACLGVFTGGGDLSDFGDTRQLYTLMGFYGQDSLPLDHPMSEVGAYLKGADPKDPAVSPIYGDLSGFPPTLLMTGTRDALMSTTALLHRALRRADVEADLFVFEAMPHAHWYMLHLPEAREAVQAMARFFDRKLGAAQG